MLRAQPSVDDLPRPDPYCFALTMESLDKFVNFPDYIFAPTRGKYEITSVHKSTTDAILHAQTALQKTESITIICVNEDNQTCRVSASYLDEGKGLFFQFGVHFFTHMHQKCIGLSGNAPDAVWHAFNGVGSPQEPLLLEACPSCDQYLSLDPPFPPCTSLGVEMCMAQLTADSETAVAATITSFFQRFCTGGILGCAGGIPLLLAIPDLANIINRFKGKWIATKASLLIAKIAHSGFMYHRFGLLHDQVVTCMAVPVIMNHVTHCPPQSVKLLGALKSLIVLFNIIGCEWSDDVSIMAKNVLAKNPPGPITVVVNKLFVKK